MQVLDFMGEVGGFMDSILALIVIFGSFFSSNLFIASVANKMVLKKDPAKTPEKGAKKLKISSCEALCLPKVERCCCCCKVVKKKAKLLEAADTKL